MFVRAAVVFGSLLAATPVLAEPLNADAARRFVAGKLFPFTCFEGSTGFGPHLQRRLGRGRRAHARQRQHALHASAGRHAVPEGRRDLLEREGRVLQSVLRSEQDRRQQLPRRGLGLRLCVLRFRAPRRPRRDDPGVGRAGDRGGRAQLDPARTQARGEQAIRGEQARPLRRRSRFRQRRLPGRRAGRHPQHRSRRSVLISSPEKSCTSWCRARAGCRRRRARRLRMCRSCGRDGSAARSRGSGPCPW